MYKLNVPPPVQALTIPTESRQIPRCPQHCPLKADPRHHTRYPPHLLITRFHIPPLTLPYTIRSPLCSRSGH